MEGNGLTFPSEDKNFILGPGVPKVKHIIEGNVVEKIKGVND